VTCDEESIREAVRKSQHSIEHIWNCRCRHIVVGPEIFGEVLGEMKELVFSFPAQFSLAYPDGSIREVRFFDMEVHVVPWFTGCLLLPEWEELR